MQAGVFGLGLFQQRKVGIRVSPLRQKVLIRNFG